MADRPLYRDESESDSLFDEFAYDKTDVEYLEMLGLDPDLLTFLLPANTTISAFGASLIDDADASAAQATLGLTTVVSNSHASGSDNQDLSGLETKIITRNFAKTQLIDGVYSIITPANVKGFWVFDETGAVDHIHGKETIGGATDHIVTFRNASLTAINASTCTPGFSGLAPYLTLNATHVWDTPDSDDFSFGDGAGNDTPFSVMILGNLTASISCVLLNKGSDTAGEWFFATDSNSKLVVQISNPDWSGFIGRLFNQDLSGEIGYWDTYGFTYSGSKAASGLKLYGNSYRVDDTDASSGSYPGMTNGNQPVASYYDAVTLPSQAKYSVVLIIAEELTAIQMARLDAVLRGYAGVFA
jgi:hypothetical protein